MRLEQEQEQERVQEQVQEQRQEWPVLLQAQGPLLRSKWKHHNP